MRLRKVKNASITLNNHPELLIQNPDFYKGKWDTLFPKNQPIHLEIGIGKGKFLFELAKLHPEINYLGIEKFDSVIVRALEKLLISPLPNVLLIYVDANRLPDLFDIGEIDKLYLNFSDPWPKNAHKKRRLTSPLFLSFYQAILRKDAVIEYKTDNFRFFEYTMMTLIEYPANIIKMSLDLHHEHNIENVETEFETRFVSMGNSIYYISFQLKEKTDD
jgi:tRNA (guanine-N7-)-methyltransferase